MNRRQTAVLALAAALLFAGLEQARATQSGERDLKAAFLYNFAKFVEWPQAAFPEPTTPVTLCVLGDDAVGASLEMVVKGEKLNDRRLVVRLLRDPQATQGCHVLFVGPEKGRLPEILAPLRGTGVLTVGGAADFLDRGGMIRLFLEQNRVRFDINLDAAEQSHLKLSSKLLRLARAVNPQRQEG
ncbi:MAG TPA: YfiR family protein [Thermoanaerobaculia bacterium]|nr:YfiR family protein [Thermoanaerobaculia bacterium]